MIGLLWELGILYRPKSIRFEQHKNYVILFLAGKIACFKIEKIVQFQIYLLMVALHEIHHTITTYFWKKWQKLIVDTTSLKSITTIFQVWIEQKQIQIIETYVYYILYFIYIVCNMHIIIIINNYIEYIVYIISKYWFLQFGKKYFQK